MKNKLFALFGLGLLLASASAYAQSINLKANVPFNFALNGKTLPTGEYTIRSIDNMRNAAAISGAEQKPLVLLTMPCLSPRNREISQESKLVFTRYGNTYFLSEVWIEGSGAGYSVPKSRLEHELQMAQKDTAHKVVVVAELR